MSDFALGHDYAKKISAVIQESGGSVQSTLFFVPLTTTDFGSQIVQLNNRPADGMAVMIAGSGSIALAKQQQPFNLFAKYKSVVSASSPAKS